MKLIVVGLLSCATALSMAQDVIITDDRQAALAACEQRAAETPASIRRQMLAACRCIVEHTDFEKAIQLSQAGEEAALQALYDGAVAACNR